MPVLARSPALSIFPPPLRTPAFIVLLQRGVRGTRSSSFLPASLASQSLLVPAGGPALLFGPSPVRVPALSRLLPRFLLSSVRRSGLIHIHAAVIVGRLAAWPLGRLAAWPPADITTLLAIASALALTATFAPPSPPSTPTPFATGAPRLL